MTGKEESNKKTQLSRRQFVGAGAAMAAAGLAGCAGSGIQGPKFGKGLKRSRCTQPLAQDYTIAARQTTKDHYMHDPGMACFPDGTIFVAAPCMEWKHKRVRRNIRPRRKIIGKELLLSRSLDGGKSWESCGTMPYDDASPFVHNDKLYMFLPVNPFMIVRSDDKGKTWTDPVVLFKGRNWNCDTEILIKDNKLYWPVGGVSVICADLSKDLMDPKTWRKSNHVGKPAIPDTLRSNLYPPSKGIWPVQWGSDLWLEPNIVNVNGHMRILLRCVIDEYATASIAGVLDLEDDGENMELKFTQFAAIPGAQNKFYIMYDEPSKLFWMLSNMPTDSQGFFVDRQRMLDVGAHGGPGNERRILMLYYSRDALNWFGAGCAAMLPSPIQAFMYPSGAIDGNDIVFISRSSIEAQNQHDADVVTFHRIKNFRSLAMDIFPVFPDGPNI